jgi:ribonuclease VapC
VVVDSSAVIALLLGEPEAPRVEAALVAADGPRLPAPAYVECSIVLARRLGDDALARLDDLLEGYGIAILPFAPDHARLAREAFLRFGKGRHPAGLNFGDCLSYAAARAEGLPLLFVGDDFARTDIAPA